MTFAIHGSKNGESVVTVRMDQIRQSTKLAYWRALAGKFILQTRLGTSLTCQNLIGFFGSIEGLPVLSHLDDTDLPVATKNSEAV